MKVIKCGTKVKTKINNIEAIVTAVSIRFDKVTYEISYFNSGDYKSVWLHENEFTEEGNIEKTVIGFK